jgi:hypothetical protein
MFKKGFDYYFDIAYILLLFLCFLFFLPYFVLALLIYIKIDNFISLQCSAFQEVCGFYFMVFCRNGLEVYFTIISLLFLYVISDRCIQSRNKSNVILGRH